MTDHEPLSGLVLAGGRSRRMGRDKAALSHGGEPALARAVRLLAGHVEKVFVSTRPDQVDDPLRAGFDRIVDTREGIGPVAGILAAMDFDPAARWLVVACDLPNLDDATIAHLVANASADHPATAYTSAHDGLPEPLCAIYRPAIREHLERYVADGVHCPRKMLINADTCLLQLPDAAALHNVNSPADLAGTGLGPLR